MDNTIQFPSESQRDEMVFETMKEFEYTSYDMFNIYLHWGKEKGLRAETEPAGDKIILKVNENGDKAWIYIKEWNGTEHKHIIEPQFCLLISDDVDQLVDVGIYRAYYIYLKYVMYLHTNKTINHDKDYVKYVKKKYLRRCEEEEYFIENKEFISDIISHNIIECFD